MTIEEGLYSYLSGYAGLTALVGTRIYPLVMPQNVTMPAIRYQRISSSRIYSHDGPNKLTHPRFQFSCFAESYATAKAVANQVRFALAGYQGTMGGAGGVTVQFAIVDDEVDLYEDETKLHHVAVDVVVWHEEATG